MKATFRNLLLTGAASLSFSVAGPAAAGDLVMEARVAKITNTGSNGNTFGIKVSGGSLNLCGTGWISFPASATDADSHKRAYAAALLALSTGVPVRVHNYQNNDCDTASYIELGAP